MVSFRTDATDSLGYLGHVFSQPPFTEFLKASQFRNLKVGIRYFAGVIKEYLYFAMAFKSGDWIYGYCLHQCPLYLFTIKDEVAIKYLL